MGSNQFHLSLVARVLQERRGKNTQRCDAAPLLQFEYSCWEIRHHFLSPRTLESQQLAPKNNEREGNEHSIRGESIRLHITRVPWKQTPLVLQKSSRSFCRLKAIQICSPKSPSQHLLTVVLSVFHAAICHFCASHAAVAYRQRNCKKSDSRFGVICNST
jgi:hypothetical protein